MTDSRTADSATGDSEAGDTGASDSRTDDPGTVDYDIGPFQEADLPGYLDLFETVFGAARTPEWFEWKYGTENPYVDEPAIFVARADGTIVGARSFFTLRMTTGESTRLALQPSDAMVHPDHRRRGLFSELTTDALDHYADREPSFCFNFPNPNSLPGNLKLGWEIVDELPTHYRLHDPAALSGALPSALAPVLSAAADAYYRFRTPNAPPSLDVSVHRDDVPAGTLSSLYRQSSGSVDGGGAGGGVGGDAGGAGGGDAGGDAPGGEHADDRIHALRDETFYEWRLAAPHRTYETHVAERGGESVAAVVVGLERRSSGTTVRVVDALAVGMGDEREAAYTALLASVLEEHGDAALVAVRGGIPPAVLRRFGFLADTSPPLSAFASTSTMVARPIGEAGWTVDGVDLRSPNAWGLTFAELDSA